MNEKQEAVNMPCKRGSDQITKGQSCDSLRAYKMRPDRSSVPMFKCVKCKYTWSIPLGGAFNVGF